jgi:hypothetical protein
MRKRHLVVLQGADNQPIVRLMQEWVRQNPQELPAGHSGRGTSHELRAALKKQGWHVEELEDKVLVVKPGSEGGISYAQALLDDDIALSEAASDEEVLEFAEEFTFGLERDLQAALRTNLEQLEPGLTIADGGQERSVEAGRIDITAQDSSGTLVAIEIKAGTALPESVAQVLAYMSCLSQTNGCPARGILIAGGFHERVVQAARSVPTLQLHKYTFQFRFQRVE